jgi:phosphonate transport system ATP-binding protein
MMEKTMSTAVVPQVAAMEEVERPAAIRMCGVWAAYDPKGFALQDVSLEVAAGERRAIVGPSGSGKSTLLKLLKGLLSPVQGEMQALGLPIQSGSRRRMGAKIGYIPQNLGLVNNATVLENALMGALHRVGGVRSWMGIFPAEAYDAAYEALEAVGISHLAQRKAHQISGGERRRLAVARALVQRPEVLLADEFLSELDDATAAQVLRGLEVARERYGMTIVIVEHNLRLACSFCDKVTVLRDGKVIADASGCEKEENNLRCLLQQATNGN